VAHRQLPIQDRPCSRDHHQLHGRLGVLVLGWFFVDPSPDAGRPSSVKAIGENAGEELLERARNSSFCRRANKLAAQGWLTCRAGKASRVSWPNWASFCSKKHAGPAGSPAARWGNRRHRSRGMQLTGQARPARGQQGPQTQHCKPLRPRRRGMGLRSGNRHGRPPGRVRHRQDLSALVFSAPACG